MKLFCQTKRICQDNVSIDRKCNVMADVIPDLRTPKSAVLEIRIVLLIITNVTLLSGIETVSGIVVPRCATLSLTVSALETFFTDVMMPVIATMQDSVFILNIQCINLEINDAYFKK